MIAPEETGFSKVSRVNDWLKRPDLLASENQFLPIAHAYTSSLGWMPRRIGYWHGLTVSGLVGVFLYRIIPEKPDVPEYHWIVVGPKWPYPEWDENRVDQNRIRNRTYSGLPHAYVWTGHPEFADPDNASNPACALESYVGVISDWVETAQRGADLAGVFPVEVPEGKTTLEYANDILPLLKKIDEEVLTHFADDLNADPPRRL